MPATICLALLALASVGVSTPIPGATACAKDASCIEPPSCVFVAFGTDGLDNTAAAQQFVATLASAFNSAGGAAFMATYMAATHAVGSYSHVTTMYVCADVCVPSMLQSVALPTEPKSCNDKPPTCSTVTGALASSAGRKAEAACQPPPLPCSWKASNSQQSFAQVQVSCGIQPIEVPCQDRIDNLRGAASGSYGTYQKQSGSSQAPASITLKGQCGAVICGQDVFAPKYSFKTAQGTPSWVLDACGIPVPDCSVVSGAVTQKRKVDACTPCGLSTGGSLLQAQRCLPCPWPSGIASGDVIDSDCDEVPDGTDNCPDVKNKDQQNIDHDGAGDACDPDKDGDGVNNPKDDCDSTPNTNQADGDHDGKGDSCDDITDSDRDGVGDGVDNCKYDANRDQYDFDHDGDGNACDNDDDNDGIPDDQPDNCPTTANPNQADSDQNGVGDACQGQTDTDGDGKWDSNDNCRTTANPDQKDSDHDGIGDACDGDRDGDGRPDSGDNCPDHYNPNQADLDGDTQGDSCDEDDDGDHVPDQQDNCLGKSNPTQADSNNNHVGDACEDRDSDGYLDGADNCPGNANPTQQDSDHDGIGDACETGPNGPDSDGDGVPDDQDNCPTVRNPDQGNTNPQDDKEGDECDPDDDGDGVPDGQDTQCPRTYGSNGTDCPPNHDTDSIPDDSDNCPDDYNPYQSDNDYDHVGDVCDNDNEDGPRGDPDHDGRKNNEDNCPNVNNPNQEDSDHDRRGDACE